MTNTKHTPAPWTFENTHKGYFDIVSSEDDVFALGHAKTEANARLIAVAPEQNSLLERMVNDRAAWQRGEIGTTDYELAMRHNLDDAVRLLAKAKGE